MILFLRLLVALGSAWGGEKFPPGILACESLLATTSRRTTNSEASFTLHALRQQLHDTTPALPKKVWSANFSGPLKDVTESKRRVLNAYMGGLQSALLESAGGSRALFVREVRGTSAIIAAALAQDQEMKQLVPSFEAASKRVSRNLPDVLRARLANPLHHTTLTGLNLGAVADLFNFANVPLWLSLPYLAATLVYDATSFRLAVASVHLRAQRGYARTRQTLKRVIEDQLEPDWLALATDTYTLPLTLQKLFTGQSTFDYETRERALAHTRSGPVAAWTAYRQPEPVGEFYFDNVIFYDQVAREPVWLSLIRVAN